MQLRPFSVCLDCISRTTKGFMEFLKSFHPSPPHTKSLFEKLERKRLEKLSKNPSDRQNATLTENDFSKKVIISQPHHFQHTLVHN